MLNLSLRSITSTEKLAISALMLPFLGWGLLMSIVAIKKSNPPQISGKPVLHVDTWLVGSRFLLADIHGDLPQTADNQWSSPQASIALNTRDRSMIFSSLAFETPATLIYDGFKWRGYTTKAGRGMPIAVEVWPDF